MARTSRRRRRRASTSRRFSSAPRRSGRRRRSGRSSGGLAGMGSPLSRGGIVSAGAVALGAVLAPVVLSRVPVLNQQSGIMRTLAGLGIAAAFYAFGRRVIPGRVVGPLATGMAAASLTPLVSQLVARVTPALPPATAVAGFIDEGESAYEGVMGFGDSGLAERSAYGMV